jgi:uncharacterized protein (TIGR02246 family)
MNIEDDEQSIRGIIAHQQIAWNVGDANAYAARFHTDGSFTNIFGDRYIGLEAFRERHAALFNGFAKGSKASLMVRRIHFALPQVAIVDVDCALEAYQTLPPGLLAPLDGALRTSLLEVLVKDEKGWWIVGYHNVDVKVRAGTTT